MARLEQREFDVVLELQPEGGYSVHVPSLPGCISEGDTREEALEMIKEAIELYLEPLAAGHESLPPPSHHEYERVRVLA